MQIELKALLIALPIAIAMYVILIAACYAIWGDSWNMSGLPVVSLATGYAAYRVAKGHLEQKSKRG